MDIFRDEILSDLLFAPEYLPDVLQWLKKQPTENGHISVESVGKILDILSYPCWKKFFQAYTRPCELSDEDLVAAEYKLLTETGLARIESVKILGEMRKSYNLFMTETAKQIISVQDPYQVDREKRRRSLIHLIAVAAVNVYGVIEKDLFINLFNHYSESPARTECSSELASFDPLSPDELESALSPYTELHVDVLLAGNHLMNRLIGGPEDIPLFLSNVSSDKYYPFAMEPLLKYANPEYFEMTPEIANFLWQIEENFPDITDGEKHLLQLLFSPSYLSDWSQMIEVELCPMIKPLREETQREIAEAFVRAKRSGRCWKLRGYSEEETSLGGEMIEEDVRGFLRVLEGC